MSQQKRITKQVIITNLQQLPEDIPINKKSLFEYYNNGKLEFHPSAIPTTFGSIKKACDEAGVRCDALLAKTTIIR